MWPLRQLPVGFAPRLAALYAAIFVMGGIQLPFFPVWLKAKGLDPQMIGMVLAAPMIARLIAVPLVARTADRHDAMRAAIIATSFLGVAGYVLVGLAEGARAILIAYALAALALTPVMPLTETYALKGLGQRGRAYGPVRLWGSAAFILGTFVAGFATDTIPARDLIWLIAAASLISALAALTLEPLSAAAPTASEPARPRQPLLRDPAFIAVLAAASLIQASHAVYYGFSALQWRGAGFDGTAIAALWALGVVAEIVLFAISGRLPPFFQPTVLHHDRRGRRRLALDGDGARSAGLRAAVAAIAARRLVRRHPSRRARLCCAPCAGRAGRDRARLSRHRDRRGDGGGDGTVRLALWQPSAAAPTAAMALAAVAGGACGHIAQRTRRVMAL